MFVEKLLIEPARHPMRQTGVMDGFDVFGNVILCTPADTADRIHARVDADVDLDAGVAFGACRLPNDAGLIYKVLGRETAQVTGQGARVLGGGARGNHRRRDSAPFLLALHRRHGRRRRPMNKLLSAWEARCASSGVLRFVDVNLRGIGQVMFQDNPLTGALFLAAIAWGSYAAGVPQIAIARRASRSSSRRSPRNGCASTETSLRAGLYGYNGVLVGLALATFIAPGPLLWVYVVLGAAVSVVVMLGTANVVKPWGVSALTFPFVLDHLAAAARDVRFLRDSPAPRCRRRTSSRRSSRSRPRGSASAISCRACCRASRRCS